jgi:hypothetical protein
VPKMARTALALEAGGAVPAPSPRLWSWNIQLAWLRVVSLSLILSSGAQVVAPERLGVEPPRRPGPSNPSFPAADPGPGILASPRVAPCPSPATSGDRGEESPRPWVTPPVCGGSILTWLIYHHERC